MGKGQCCNPKKWVKNKTQDRRMQQMRFFDSEALNKNVFSLPRCLFHKGAHKYSSLAPF